MTNDPYSPNAVKIVHANRSFYKLHNQSFSAVTSALTYRLKRLQWQLRIFEILAVIAS